MIQSNCELDQCCRELQAEPVLCLDTEFERTRTYYARPALLQLGIVDRCWLVDPLKIDEWSAFRDLLEAPDRQIIMHSAREDAELLFFALGIRINGLFDTQIAAGLCGRSMGMGYARLVEEATGEVLDKGATRSNWIKRPLSERQLRYARDDVKYLPLLGGELRRKLEQLGRLAWCLEESEVLVESATRERNAERCYLRLNGVDRLEVRALGVAQKLAEWREDTARRRDLPRGFLVRDEVITKLSRVRPTALNELESECDLHPGLVRRYGREILSLVEAGGNMKSPEPPLPPLRDKQEKQMVEQVRERIREVAEQLGVEAPVIGGRRMAEELVYHAMGLRPGAALRNGWRGELFGEALFAALSG